MEISYVPGFFIEDWCAGGGAPKILLREKAAGGRRWVVRDLI